MCICVYVYIFVVDDVDVDVDVDIDVLSYFLCFLNSSFFLQTFSFVLQAYVGTIF